MNTCLAEKLMTLRKAYQFSQSDVAKELSLTVQEYMDFENGNEFCGIEILQKLALLYKVPIQSLIDNRKALPLPRKEDESIMDSVQIPFQTMINSQIDKDFTADLMPISSVIDETLEQDGTDLVDDMEDIEENIGDTIGYDATVVQHVTKDKRVSSASSVNQKGNKETVENSRKKASKKSIILIALAGFLIGVVLFFVLKKMMKHKQPQQEQTIIVARNMTNRLALASEFALYVKDNGSIVSTGNRNLSEFTEVAQVVSGDRHALLLKTDGSVLCSGDGVACDVSKWFNIQMVAAGTTHSAGLKSDGTVICTGSTEACDVQKWTDVKEIFAGNHITIGKKTDGKLLISGNINQKAKLVTLDKVSSVVIGEEQIAVLDHTGKVNCYPIGTGNTSNTAGWNQITQIAMGNHFVAGLKSDGTVVVASTDDTYAKAIAEWKGIRYIAGYKNTLIAVDSSEQIIGAGANENQVYGVAKETPQPTATPTSTPKTAHKLASVKNIQYSVSNDNVVITWDAVESAIYYLVEVNTNPMTSVKAVNNSTSIAINKLVNKATYKVSIIPIAEDKENNGNVQIAAFTYTIEAQKLATPVGISGEVKDDGLLIRFNRVENATKYIVRIGDKQQETTDLSVLFTDIADGTYTVSVVATNEDKDHFTSSDAGTLTATYTAVVKEYTLTVKFIDEQGFIVAQWINPKKIKTGPFKQEITAPEDYVFKETMKEKMDLEDNMGKGDKTVQVVVVEKDAKVEGN